MSNDLSDAALSRIHEVPNYWKFLAYWIGFLKGVVASGALEQGEVPALKAQCESFLSSFVDGDATDILADLEMFDDEPKELLASINDIISSKDDSLEYAENIRPNNEFFGFLKGIACDGVITIREIKKLYEFIDGNEAYRKDFRIYDIKTVCECALEDGQIDKEESEEICSFIAKVVGDGFCDTGISSSRDIPQLDGMLSSIDIQVLEGKNVVLTGDFKLSKAPYQKALEKCGANIHRKTTKETDLVILAEAGSEHYVTPNAGTNILRAIDYRERFGKPDFAMEHMLRSLLSD